MATWLITGCSTGPGWSLAEAVLQAGHDAVITAMVVEPGGLRTGFAGRSLTRSPGAIDDYAELAEIETWRELSAGTDVDD